MRSADAPTAERRRGRPAVTAVVLAGVAVLLAACGAGGSTPDPAGASPAGFPVTVTSCGRSITLAAPPTRVVILSPVIARDMVELGLGDRIVGQSGTDFFLPPPQTAGVPVLSPNTRTSTEVLLGARPDLVISDLSYRLTPAEGGASLDRLAQAGVPSYVSAAGCGEIHSGGKVTDGFTDLDDLGRMFGVADRAQALGARLRADLADVERRVAGQPPAMAFAGTVYGGQYYPVSGLGLDVLGRAGGRSVFGDVADANAPVSKEEITARNPQVIVDQISYPGSFDQQKELASVRTTFPTTAAVRDNRIHLIGYVVSAEPGSAVETVAAVRQLAIALHPTAFGR